MTLVQLEYIVAVDTYKSFVSAAEKCFVTQPTLSMQIQKLEETLNVKIFDRSKQPISTTDIGALIVKQARKILQESNVIKEIISEQQKSIIGELRIGVIPTIAPYLLPEVIAKMQNNYPELNLLIWEYTTEDIIHHLNNGVIDCGILATPLEHSHINEHPMYYERFVGYVSNQSHLFNQTEISAKDFGEEEIWLLNEGHCMRTQVLNICSTHKKYKDRSFTYQTGSVETLIRMVDINGGSTLLPELSLHSLGATQMAKIRPFKAPQPVREISLVTHSSFVKNRMLNILKNEILSLIPEPMQIKSKKQVIKI